MGKKSKKFKTNKMNFNVKQTFLKNLEEKYEDFQCM